MRPRDAYRPLMGLLGLAVVGPLTLVALLAWGLFVGLPRAFWRGFWRE